MRLAWLTPFSQRSAIGYFSAIVIKALAQRAEIDIAIYVSDADSAGGLWDIGLPVRLMKLIDTTALMRELQQFDMCIYNIGDYAPYHARIFEVALQIPGIVILHDLVIHHMLSHQFIHVLKDNAAYIREITYAHGEEGGAFAEAVISSRIQPWHDPALLDIHGAKSALYRCLGVVTHSHYAQNVLTELASAPVIHIPFPSPQIEDALPEPAHSLPKDDHRLHLFTFGVINQNKCVLEVIEAIAQSDYLRSNSVYHVLGSAETGYLARIKEAIRAHQLDKQVIVLGFQPDDVLKSYLRAADVVINLRNPHFGEASWSLLEATWLGKPTVVWKHGFYDEFPDDTVIKISAFSELKSTLESICQDETLRDQISQRTRAYVHQTFNTESYCDTLLSVIDAARYNRPALQFADYVSDVLVEMGAAFDSPYLTEAVTRELTGLLGEADGSMSAETSARGSGSAISQPTVSVPKRSITSTHMRLNGTAHFAPDIPAKLTVGRRLTASVRYYRLFPAEIAPYLTPIPEWERVLPTRAGGFYDRVRIGLRRLKLDQTVERVIGTRLILTVRHFLSYPNVADLYVLPSNHQPS